MNLKLQCDGATFNLLYSDGFSHTDKSNKDRIVHYIFHIYRCLAVSILTNCNTEPFPKRLTGRRSRQHAQDKGQVHY